MHCRTRSPRDCQPEIEPLQTFDLIEREIRIIRSVGDLRERHQLGQRRHRRRMCGIRRVVIEPAQFGFDAVRRETAGSAAFWS